MCLGRAQFHARRDLPKPLPRSDALPVFGTNDEALECSLLLLGTCAINESLACEWLRASWATASDRAAAELHRAFLADEIDHARIGWAHLGSTVVTPTMRELLRTRWVEPMLASNLAAWRKPDKHLPVEGIPALGHLSHANTQAVVDTALATVIRPGLAHVGL